MRLVALIARTDTGSCTNILDCFKQATGFEFHQICAGSGCTFFAYFIGNNHLFRKMLAILKIVEYEMSNG